MIILLQFQDYKIKTIKAKELANAINVDFNQMDKLVLDSLKKANLIMTHNDYSQMVEGGDDDDSLMISFNEKFEINSTRDIREATLQAEEGSNRDEHSDLKKTKKQYILPSVLRILKSHRTNLLADHSSIKTKRDFQLTLDEIVLKAHDRLEHGRLRFLPKPEEIKTALDRAIQRNFVEEEIDQNSQTFLYSYIP